MSDTSEESTEMSGDIEHEIFDLHPATVFMIFSKIGVNMTDCKECGHKEIPFFYAPDRENGTIPRVASLGLTPQNTVAFSPSNYLAMVYLVCRNCGYIRMYSAYPLLAKINELGLVVDGSRVTAPK